MRRSHAVLLFFLVHAASAPRALPAPIGGNFEISGPDCRFPDAAYGSAAGRYLVVWADYTVTRVYGRRVTDSGEVDGDPFPISEAPFGALFPAVAYGEAKDEFLVTWDDFGGRGESIYGQLVRGSDGALLATNFAIGSHAGGIRSAVAWSPESDVFLVVYFAGGAGVEVYGQRVSGAGALLGGNFNISSDGVFSGYPAVAWGGPEDRFLVTWDNEDGNIHGRRVDAATGALVGPTILVTSGGAKDRSSIAHDPLNARWLVQYNDGANAGYSYDQYGRFVNLDGTLSGGPIPLAHTAAFEGDTQFGGDIAFAPLAGRFFSSFGTDTGMGGQESYSSGAPVGPQTVLGTGYYTSLSNAADTRRNRFLTAWEGLEGKYRIYGQLSAATLGPPADFAALPEDSRVLLSWRNPDEPHLAGTMVRFRTDGYPADPGDGELVVDRSGSPGSTDGFLHDGLTNWTTCYYSAFAHDGGPNYSLAARTAATPRSPPETLFSSEFIAGADGWTIATWRSGGLSPGTAAWDPAQACMVFTGSGITNNLDSCTREGASIARVISTAGRFGIQVEYDSMASLHAPPVPSGPGGCAVLEGTLEDQLVVSYSASGTGGPWTVAQVLAEGSELPSGWTRRLINLAGTSVADDNPDFALRFQWQFNNERDAGGLDNIRVLSGAVTGPTPAIELSASALERTIEAGEDLPGESFFVWNSGEGVLDFNVTEDIPWLAVSPPFATSAGPPRRVTIGYDTSGLAAGIHEGALRISSALASNSPRTLTVLLRVVPPACLRDPFSYYDGGLTVMGGASWGGSATDQILVEGGALKVVGGSGAVSAARSVSCASPGGIVSVRLKIQKGSGTGDFFWNIAIDDDAASPANLARFYGGSGIARGRVGGLITADMVLSGPAAWDDLLVRIDPAAGASEFFFNGTSYGTIPNGSVSGALLGAIRIERLDRAGTGGDSIGFDDLIVETVPLFHRGDPDSSGAMDLSDCIVILDHLFLDGPAPACLESADSTNDGRVDISDVIYPIFFLFADGPPPPEPGPPGSPCGADPDIPGSEGSLGCGAYEPCLAR